ncbi:alpha/beta fold hydrolase [Allokutzneria oryzae]|uniref:Alpha/beta fold hydrolase n=1 Tax=Allokutzneria oryzae TaxID=1378989 RepID=A0ABV6A1J9_9PSEU
MRIYRTTGGGEAVQRRYEELLDMWPVPAERVTVPTRFGETFVLVFGAEDAPPLLALQGSGGNAAMWLPNAEELAKRHRVYAVDVVGEPGLSAPNRLELGTEEHALWMDDVLQGLGLKEPVAVVGISLGGWLAIDYASRRPERVSRLALLVPGGVGKFRKGLVVKLLAYSLLGELGRRKSLASAIGVGGPVNEWSSTIGDFVLLIFKHFKPRTGLPTFDDDALRRLSMPVFVMVGAKDPMMDSATTARRFRESVPHAMVQVLPEAGHDLSHQIPEVLGFTASGT